MKVDRTLEGIRIVVEELLQPEGIEPSLARIEEVLQGRRSRATINKYWRRVVPNFRVKNNIPAEMKKYNRQEQEINFAKLLDAIREEEEVFNRAESEEFVKGLIALKTS